METQDFLDTKEIKNMMIWKDSQTYQDITCQTMINKIWKDQLLMSHNKLNKEYLGTSNFCQI